MTREKTAFVMAGGGSLGAVEVGMLKALAEHGLEPDFIVGSSVGAINAAFYAADPGEKIVKRLERIWRDLRREDIFPLAAVRGLLGFLSLRDSMVDPAPFRRFLEHHLPYRKLEDAKLQVCIVATDILSGMEVRLTSGTAVDALLASAAMPAVFPPVRIDERFLSDGGIANNTPISAAVEMHARRVIVLPTGFSCSLESPPRGALAMALHALNLLIARQLVTDVERFSQRTHITVVPPLCPLGVSSIDFSSGAELIDRAHTSTRRWIEHGGLDKATVPSELIAHVHIA